MSVRIGLMPYTYRAVPGLSRPLVKAGEIRDRQKFVKEITCGPARGPVSLYGKSARRLLIWPVLVKQFTSERVGPRNCGRMALRLDTARTEGGAEIRRFRD